MPTGRWTSPRAEGRYAPAVVATDDEGRDRRLAAAAGDLAEIERALDRLDAGTYFQCEHCGAALTDAWLSAHPVARTCEGCSAAAASPE